MRSKDNKFASRIIPFECEDCDWNLLLSYFALRSAEFVGRQRWDIYDHEGYELDAYDKETSYYVITTDIDTGEVVGGSRLSPTVHPGFVGILENDPASFMILDACNGLLKGLPTNLCFEAPPTGEHVWELTRVVVSRPDVVLDLYQAGTLFLRSLGVSKCVALGSPAIMRIARQLSGNPIPIGPLVRNDSGAFRAFICDVPDPYETIRTTNQHHAEVIQIGAKA